MFICLELLLSLLLNWRRNQNFADDTARLLKFCPVRGFEMGFSYKDFGGKAEPLLATAWLRHYAELV
jgi:hypothetical protein